jgi:hypothetical protein
MTYLPQFLLLLFSQQKKRLAADFNHDMNQLQDLPFEHHCHWQKLCLDQEQDQKVPLVPLLKD